MKRTKFTIVSLVLLTLIIAGCSNPEEVPKGEFSSGVFIVNEGNFSESNGSVGFYNESNLAIDLDIFEKANGVSSGGVIQSIYFYQNLAFILDQVGNRIEVVEAETFKSVATISSGFNTPRYMVVANGKGYVSNWGAFDTNLFDFPDSYVAVVDLQSYTVTKSIKTANGSEGLLAYGGKVYVANSYSNTIEIIDPETDEVSGSMTVAHGPLGFTEDKNGKIWVLSSSFTAGSALSQVDLATKRILKSFLVGASAKSLNINGAGDKLYYLTAPFGSDAEVKEISIDATADADEALITAPNLYGLGVDPKTEVIYLGNHNGFQGNGTVLRYQGGTLLDTFAAGIAPNGFVFR
jgi:YVTN family beta-propeller protein